MLCCWRYCRNTVSIHQSGWRRKYRSPFGSRIPRYHETHDKITRRSLHLKRDASCQKHIAVRRPYTLLPTIQYAQKRAPTIVDALFSLNQRLPILPGRFQPSTFGVYGLNCCVRHGNRWIPVAIVTELCCRARALTTTWKSIYSVLTFLTRTS